MHTYNYALATSMHMYIHACVHMLLALNVYYSNLWYGGCHQERLGHSSDQAVLWADLLEMMKVVSNNRHKNLQ